VARWQRLVRLSNDTHLATTRLHESHRPRLAAFHRSAAKHRAATAGYGATAGSLALQRDYPCQLRAPAKVVRERRSVNRAGSNKRSHVSGSFRKLLYQHSPRDVVIQESQLVVDSDSARLFAQHSEHSADRSRMTVRLNLTESPRPLVSFSYRAPSRSGTARRNQGW
jgi:hypothetical protein